MGRKVSSALLAVHSCICSLMESWKCKTETQAMSRNIDWGLISTKEVVGSVGVDMNAKGEYKGR